jgi:hypothetical protein
MMSSWRSKGLTASLCGTAVLVAWAVAGVPDLNSKRINKSNLVPIQDHSITSFCANTGSPLQASTAMVKADTSQFDLATSASEAATTKSIEASVLDSVAINTSGDWVNDERKKPVSSTEVLDECFVPEICIDRYLWMLYQRTPKLDAIKVVDEQKVTVKKDDKTRIIIKKVTKLLNEDFTWKDPEAAEKAGLSLQDYVIGGMDPSFKLKLYRALRASQEAGFSPGITSAFRDDYRQSITSGLKAATDRSFHGGSFRGGYGHGLAADIVSVNGEAHESTERLWEWIDAHGNEFGIGRPYLDKDPPHVAPIDGEEYAAHHSDALAQYAESKKKKNKGRVHNDRSTEKRLMKPGSKSRLSQQVFTDDSD